MEDQLLYSYTGCRGIVYVLHAFSVPLSNYSCNGKNYPFEKISLIHALRDNERACLIIIRSVENNKISNLFKSMILNY